MSTRMNLGGHDSFLNRLLVLREQEVLNLSKKLHHQAALDSDGGSGRGQPQSRRHTHARHHTVGVTPSPTTSDTSSPTTVEFRDCTPDVTNTSTTHEGTTAASTGATKGLPRDTSSSPAAAASRHVGVSEGSLGSPEPNSLSISPPPPSSPHHRLHSPTAGKPEFVSTSSRLHYDDRHHHHDQRQDQVDQRHRVYNDSLAERYDLHHPYSIRSSDENNDDDDPWGNHDPREDKQQEVREQQEGPEEEEDRRNMNELTDSLQQRQQMALAARALIGTLASPVPTPPLLPFQEFQPTKLMGGPNLLVRALATTNPRRPRGEKKPIPDTLKDDKYFERRKRNNLAAKKSRDARKQREDQVATLREEATSLRNLLLQKKAKRH
ncbi:Hepatic leukemia factor-like 1 [Homarus americanus]|uniref:Hepatic leukemia factor-like 1 n=1 Tax=Homarus americanus TaxID=6706 RepID=A0A8J5N7L3_HOMAM|nr:Hepatic leukemia factor-like 1 [Homarus americanus]